MSVPDDPRPFPLRAAPEPSDEPSQRPQGRDAASAPTTWGDDLRALLMQTEERVDLLRGTAAELNAVLPTRVEAAVSRALLSSRAPAAATGDLARLGVRVERMTGAVEAMERDLLAERLSRAEDLEVLVDLVRAATAAVRDDVERVEHRLSDLSSTVAGFAVTVRSLGPALAAVATKLDRPLAVTVDARRAGDPAEPVRSAGSAVPPPAGDSFPPPGSDAF